MKISIFNQFGALNSPPVFFSVEAGLKKLNHTVLYHDLNADVFIIWSVLWSGRMIQNKLIWDYAVENKIPVIVLEVGCLKRGQTWRIGLNGINHLPTDTSNRSSKLHIELSPWRKKGSKILICGQRTASLQWTHGNQREWLTKMILDLRLYTDRDIIFRPHPREILRDDCRGLDITIQVPEKIDGTYDSYNFDVRDAWVVINPSSNPGVQSLIQGCPCIVDSHSLAYELSTKIENIETPRYDDREEWFEKICHTEWTLLELQEGTPIKTLLDSII